jgi:type II secretory pathway pseudopilin PulG
MNCKVFTLAEVLITLGVIGVVSALTLPTLIQNHKNRELQSQFKKSYSTLSQILQRVVAEEYGGIAPIPTSSSTRIILDNMAKYASNSKVCYGTKCDTNIFPFPNTYLQTLNTLYTNTSTGLMDDGAIALNDGSTIFVDYGNGRPYYFFIIDINGAKKKPNSGGIDVFYFQLLPDGKLIPIGTPTNSPRCSNTSIGA